MLMGLYFISGIIALVLMVERIMARGRDGDHRQTGR